VATYVILGAIFLIVRDFIWSDLERWRPQVEQVAQRFTGNQVSITGLRGHVADWSPGVSAQRIQITDDGVQKLNVQVDRVSDRMLEVAGMPIELPELPEITVPEKREGLQRWQLPEWILEQHGFQITNISVDYTDRETQRKLSISNSSVHTKEVDGRRDLVVKIPSLTNPDGSFEFRANLSKETTLNPLDPPNWQGKAWVQLTKFDTGVVSSMMRTPWLLREGMLGGQAWFSLKNSAPASAQVDVSGAAMQFQAEDAQAVFQSAAAQVNAQWADDGSVELTVTRAEATDRNGTRITVSDAEHTATFDSTLKPLRAKFSIKGFDVQRFQQFAMQLPLPGDLKKPFAQLNVDGEIKQFSMSFDGTSEPTKFAIESRFEKLTIGHGDIGKSPRQWGPEIPTAENISGEVKLTHLGGEAVLRGEDAAIGFPGVFADPRIPFEKLALDLTWQVHALATEDKRADVSVQFKRFDFSNKDADGSVTGNYRTAQVGPGVIDLSGQLTRARASRVFRYMPMAIKTEVRNWMRESFVGGKSNDTRIVLSGDLFDFPFREPGSGTFSIDALVDNATFKYAPDWPKISKMKARVKIERGGLEVRTNDASIYSVGLTQTTARIADFRNAVLKLEGTAIGAAPEMLRYIRESPMQGGIREFATTAKIQGTATTNILLTLPFDDDLPFRLSGSTQLDGARVKLNPELPLLTQVSGLVKFSGDGVDMQGVTARTLGGPINIGAAVRDEEPSRIQLTGTASAEGLREFVDFPVTRALAGQAAYQAKVVLHNDTRSITVTSDLAGMSAALPPPMYKAAKDKLALTVTLKPLESRGFRLRGEQLTVLIPDDEFEAVFRRDSTNEKKLSLNKAVVSIGDSAPAVLPDSGFKLALSGLPINFDRWMDYWERDQKRAVQTPENPESFFAGFDPMPTEVTMVLPSLRFKTKRLHDVVLGATRNGRVWSANLRTTEANGFLTYVDAPKAADSSIKAHFSRLEIPESETIAFDNLLEAGPAQLPSLDVTADKFVLGGKRLGRLKVAAMNRDKRWFIDELSLQHRAARFAASGQWQPAAKQGELATQIVFDLDIIDAGLLLSDLGMPGTLAKSPGKLTGSLSWAGAPTGIDLPSLDGSLSLSMGRGQFLKTEPGIAKLIGVLSLQSLGRRLTLDFSDVFENGFAYDAIVGRAAISAGVAQTESLLMHGIQAEVLIDGTADLAKETQNLTVKVAPHINAGIASLAYAALANPAVGLGTLLAQIVLDKPLKEIFGYEFLVTGNWDSPAVTQIQRDDKDPLESNVYTPG